MNRRRLCGTLIIAAIAMGACGGEATDRLTSAAQPAPTPSTFTTTLPWTPSQTNWDGPPGAVDVPNGSTPGDAGVLAFAPVEPQAAQPPVRVVVSDPTKLPSSERWVLWIYHMPTGVDFPTDGHLWIQESAAGPLTPDLLQQIATENAGSGQYRAIQIGPDPGLLITGNGVGRVILLHGNIKVDITGPDVTPSAVQSIAARFVRANS